MENKFAELRTRINKLSDVIEAIANTPNEELKTLDSQLLLAEYHSTTAELVPKVLPLIDKLIDFASNFNLTERALLEEDVLNLLSQL